MKRLLRVLAQLPLATALGAGLGFLVALVAAVLSATPLRLTVHPLAPFALAIVPAALGMWVDWSRLWKPTRRTRFWSFGVLAISAAASVQAAVVAGGVGSRALALAPAVPLAMAAVAFFGARALTFLGRRGVRVAGFELACGTIRREEIDRLVVDTGAGALEVARDASPDLGSNRTIDLGVGSTVALLGRVTDAAKQVGPFRTEPRSRASMVLGVASSPSDLERTVRRRARAWVGYLAVLAVGALAFAATVAYQPACDPACALLAKTW